MRCPYCVSEIDDAALACPHCAHDLYLFKPLLEKVGQLEKAVAESAEAAGAAATRIAQLEAELANTALQESAAKAPATGYPRALAEALLPALVLLVAAHWLLLFVYDVKPIALRLATIFIPMPFGFLLAARYPNEFRRSLLAAGALALAGVFGMLTVTAVIDNVPLLPQDQRDWRETFEYVLSIALAFATGLLLGEYHARRKLAELRTNRVVLLLARAFVPNEEGKLGIEKAVKTLTKLQEGATPVVTGAAAVYAGVKAFLG